MSHEPPSLPFGDGEDPDSSAGEIFSVLAHEYRRSAVSYLARRDATVSVGELVDAVADELDARGGDDRARLAIALHHVHLPKMDAAGVVSYDHERDAIDPAPELHRAGAVLARF